MRKLKFILDRQSLEIIYTVTSFIRPILEYADMVWDNCTQYEINALEKIQIEAAQIATGATKLVSLDILYRETGWELLEKSRHKHKLCLFIQMNTGVSPNYLSSLIPASVEVLPLITCGTQIILDTHCPELSCIIDHVYPLV